MELYYNPERMTESEIKGTFVARQWMLDELLSIVKKQPKGAGLQHVLLLGPRGMGKTTMLLMLRLGILESKLADRWIPVRFPEESYSITDLADFWISVIAHLSYEIKEPELLAAVDGLKKESRDSTDLAGAAVATLKNWSRKNGKRVSILVDNLDLILEQIRDENENARLRDLLMNDGTFMLVGTATSFFKEARAYEQPLYNFFKTYDLTALNLDQANELLRRRATADQNAGFEEQIKRNAGRIRVLHYFTGGSPRLVLMLYRIIASSEPVDAMRGLEKLLDEVTPYYKAKIEVLPPQQRKILDNLARVSGKTHEGLTPTQLAEETRLPVNQVSSQLKRLLELGYVAAANIRSKNSYYSLAEPLYAIWHQMRFGRQRLGWLVEFLKGWYSEGEGLEQCGKLAEAFKGLIGDATRVGEALDIRQCFVDALPMEYRGGELDRLIRDCLDAGDLFRVREILPMSDLGVVADETLSQLKERGIVSPEREAAVIAELEKRTQVITSSVEARDMSRVLSELDPMKLYFHRAPVLWRVRGGVLRALGRRQEALHDYDAYLARAQDEDAELERADLLLELHDYGLAAQASAYILARNPHSWKAYAIRATCEDVTGQFDEAVVSWRKAIENGAPQEYGSLTSLEFPGARSVLRFLLLLSVGDHETCQSVWPEFAEQLTVESVTPRVSAGLRFLLGPTNLSFLQRLIKATPAEDILLPLARAMDYLISRERNIIGKLSSEVRPIVEEIVAEYEKKYPQKAVVPPQRRTRRLGAL